MLIGEVETILEESGYRYCEYSGCFDIAARRDSLLLLKILDNVDSFQEEQANNLKILSSDIDASALLVGTHTRRESLSANVIYERFDIPTISPSTLGSMLSGTNPSLSRSRGGLFVNIDPKNLRQARETAGLSQAVLASKIGVTKKSVYEHETKKMKILYSNALRLEKTLKTDLIIPIEITPSYYVETRPRSVFESRISRKFHTLGFSTDSVYQAPFNMIASGKFMVISDVEQDAKKIEKNVPYMEKFSSITKKPALIVTNEEVNFNVPSVRESELSSFTPGSIRKLLKNW